MESPEQARLNQWIRQEIRGLQAYQPEASDATIRLDANESPFDVPAEIKQTILNRCKQVQWQCYPDPDCSLLKKEIAAFENVNPNQVMIGNGSDELIRDLLTAFGGPGRRVVFPTPTFSMYRLLTIASGGIPVGVHLKDDWSLDLEGLLQEVCAENTRLVFMATPNNPTGYAYESKQLEQIIAATNGLVIIDEAYRLFADTWQRALLNKYANVILMHTFSKSFSLAGLRVGYMIADPAIIDTVNKVRLPYNVDSLAQVAALTVLQHKEHWLNQANQVKQERQRIEGALAACSGLDVYPSQANFILIRHELSEVIKQALKQANIVVRGFEQTDGLQQCLRITIGQPEQNDQLIQIISSTLAKD